MKTHARYAYVMTLFLGPVGGCGDDADSTDETVTAGSTSEASTSEGESTDADPSTSGTPGSTSEDPSGDSSSSGGSDGDSTGTEDPFASCSREVLEGDLAVVNAIGVPGAPQWYGPGADADGALVDDGESDYVVSVTYLALKPDADFDHFTQLNVANSMALYANPGMVAVQLGFSMECSTARTFTVWESEEAMMAFVGSDAHLASVAAFSTFSRGGSTLSVWPQRVPAAEISWDAALAGLADATPYD